MSLHQSAPEPEQRWFRALSAPQTVLAAASVTLLVVLLDLVLTGALSFFFDVCFVTICLGTGLLARPGQGWNVALTPPVLVVGVVLFLAVLAPGRVAEADDSVVQALVTGITRHAVALFGGYLLFLGALWSGSQTPAPDAATPGTQSSKRDGSPAPTRSTSG